MITSIRLQAFAGKLSIGQHDGSVTIKSRGPFFLIKYQILLAIYLLRVQIVWGSMCMQLT
jgi:hypothetical protein